MNRVHRVTKNDKNGVMTHINVSYSVATILMMMMMMITILRPWE